MNFTSVSEKIRLHKPMNENDMLSIYSALHRYSSPWSLSSVRKREPSQPLNTFLVIYSKGFAVFGSIHLSLNSDKFPYNCAPTAWCYDHHMSLLGCCAQGDAHVQQFALRPESSVCHSFSRVTQYLDIRVRILNFFFLQPQNKFLRLI